MSSQVLTPDSIVLPLKGKYDKRKNNGANLADYRSPGKSGRKCVSRQDKAGRAAIGYLRKMNAHKSPLELYEDAIAARNYSLAWQIRSDVETRALGRPYVAINPDEVKRHDDADVSRIAIAIKNLQIVQQKELPALTKQKRKAIEAAAKPAPHG